MKQRPRAVRLDRPERSQTRLPGHERREQRRRRRARRGRAARARDEPRGPRSPARRAPSARRASATPAGRIGSRRRPARRARRGRARPRSHGSGARRDAAPPGLGAAAHRGDASKAPGGDAPAYKALTGRITRGIDAVQRTLRGRRQLLAAMAPKPSPLRRRLRDARSDNSCSCSSPPRSARSRRAHAQAADAATPCWKRADQRLVRRSHRQHLPVQAATAPRSRTCPRTSRRTRPRATDIERALLSAARRKGSALDAASPTPAAPGEREPRPNGGRSAGGPSGAAAPPLPGSDGRRRRRPAAETVARPRPADADRPVPLLVLGGLAVLLLPALPPRASWPARSRRGRASTAARPSRSARRELSFPSANRLCRAASPVCRRSIYGPARANSSRLRTDREGTTWPPRRKQRQSRSPTRSSRTRWSTPRRHLGVRRYFTIPGRDPFDEIEWEIARRAHPGQGQAGVRAEGRRVPEVLVADRDEHRRAEVLPRPPRLARARAQRQADDRPRRRHDRRLGPRGRLLRERRGGARPSRPS